MLKKSKGNRFHQQGFIFSTFPINFIICLTPYRKASITGAFFIFKRKENIMGVRVVFPDMGKDPSVQLIEKTITENGTYDAITDGANGYSKVNVNVEGGGGSSDFSTAEVTVSINNDEGFYMSGSVEIIDNEMLPSEAFVSGNYTLVLYKGSFKGAIESPSEYRVSNATSTGGITITQSPLGGRLVNITGDGTLTVELTHK